MNKKSLIATILGILFIAVAVYYWATPAGSLPSFVPGYVASSSIIHIKHGVAAFLLGCAFFIYAWFAGAKKAS